MFSLKCEHPLLPPISQNVQIKHDMCFSRKQVVTEVNSQQHPREGKSHPQRSPLKKYLWTYFYKECSADFYWNWKWQKSTMTRKSRYKGNDHKHAAIISRRARTDVREHRKNMRRTETISHELYWSLRRFQKMLQILTVGKSEIRDHSRTTK